MADEAKGTEGTQGNEDRQVTRSHPVFDEYRQKIQAGETVFTAEAAAAREGAQGGARAETEPSPEDEAAAEAGAEAAADAAAAAAQAGEEEEEAAAGVDAGGEEETAAAGAEGDDGAGEDEIVVELPGRAKGETVKFTVYDQEDADHLRRLAREGLRRDAYNELVARMEEDRRELDEIAASIEADAAGFVLQRVPKDQRLTVAKALLLDDELWSELEADEDLGIERTHGSDERRRTARLQSEKDRRDAKDAADRTIAVQRAARDNVRRISGDIAGLVGSMDDDKAVRFQRAALSSAEAATLRLGHYVSRDELIEALREDGLLDRFGVDPGAAPADPQKPAAGTRRGAGKPAARDERAAGKPASSTPEGLRKARARRRSVAGSAPAGAGAPPATIELPKTTSVKDRIKEVRKRGLGAVLSGKT